MKFAVRNSFTGWIDINRVSTDFRIAILNHTIDHAIYFHKPYFSDFHSLREQFERTYAHLKFEFPWFFQDFNDLHF